MKMVDMIFDILTVGKGGKFNHSFQTPALLSATKAVWEEALFDHGVTMEQAKMACKLAIERPGFGPDLADFLALCKPTPDSMGLPDENSAYEEACRNSHPSTEHRWTHEAVRHAAREVGSYELQTLNRDKSFPLFKAAYKKICEALARGEPLPKIGKVIPLKDHQPVSPEQASLRMAMVKSLLDDKKDCEHGDGN